MTFRLYDRDRRQQVVATLAGDSDHKLSRPDDPPVVPCDLLALLTLHALPQYPMLALVPMGLIVPYWVGFAAKRGQPSSSIPFGRSRMVSKEIIPAARKVVPLLDTAS
jgi:hypothetical protein